jgi:hypothetical protein
VVGFGGGPRGLAVVARNRVLVGKLGRMKRGDELCSGLAMAREAAIRRCTAPSVGDSAREGGRGVRRARWRGGLARDL